MADLRIPLDYKEKNLPRAAWNLSQSVISTLMQCLNVPMKFETLKPKDDVDVNYEYIMQSMPMVGQLLNDWKLRIFTFKSSLSNYYGWMDNNTRQHSDAWKGKRHHFIGPSIFYNNTSTFDSLMALFCYGHSYLSLPDSFYKSYTLQYGCVVPSFIISQIVAGENGLESIATTNSLAATYNNGTKLFVRGGSLLDMIGIPASFISSREFDVDNLSRNGELLDLPYSKFDCFTADYILCYLDSVRNYLVNNQYSFVPYLYNAPYFEYNETLPAKVIVKFAPQINDLSLAEIDSFFMELRMQPDGCDIFSLAVNKGMLSIACWLCSLKYGGHFLAQYERDMLTTLMYNGSQSEVLINVDDNGNFSINQLRFANRYQLMQDRAEVAGGRYRDRLRTIWGSDDHSKLDIPQLVGVNSYRISPRGVISTADTYNSETGAGSSAGQLNGVVNTDSHSKYKHSIYSEDDSILMFMVQLVPDVVYSNGIGKGLDVHLFDDEYTPQFDQLGFQDVPLYKYNALPSYKAESGYLDSANSNPLNVVGKNLAFIDLISNVGRVHGKFANDEYFESWVLKRTFDNEVDVEVLDYEGNPSYVTIGNSVKAISPYANPLKYQYPFAVQSIDDPNFVFMFGLDIRAVRSKGKSYMPTLGQ